jgi:hypothetical protein
MKKIGYKSTDGERGGILSEIVKRDWSKETRDGNDLNLKL